MSAVAMTEEKFYTVKEVAEYLRVHPRTIRKMILDGQVQAIKVRDEYRIRQSALEDYIQKQSRRD